MPDHPFLPDGVCRALTNGRHTSGGSSSVTRASFNVSVIEDHRVCLECGNATFIGRISAPTGCAEEPPRDGVGTAAGSVLSNAAMRFFDAANTPERCLSRHEQVASLAGCAAALLLRRHGAVFVWLYLRVARWNARAVRQAGGGAPF